jgi:hypothetical protein
MIFTIRKGFVGAEFRRPSGPGTQDGWTVEVNAYGVRRTLTGKIEDVTFELARFVEEVERGEHVDEEIPF